MITDFLKYMEHGWESVTPDFKNFWSDVARMTLVITVLILLFSNLLETVATLFSIPFGFKWIMSAINVAVYVYIGFDFYKWRKGERE